MDNLSVQTQSLPPESPVLSVKSVSKCFGQRQVLTNVSFEIYPGEILGLLGPNGSGKTTTIKLALGLLNITSGEITICGYNVKADFEKAVSQTGAIIENPEMYKNLTGRQNLMQYYRMYDSIPLERVNEVIKAVHLERRIDEKISKYSLGMRQRLGLAQALLNSPKLLMLDEPTNGLDPEGIKELRDTIIDLSHNHGVAVLVSSHLLSELENLCDKVCVINGGKTVGTKTMEEIKHATVDGKEVYILKVKDCEGAKEIFASLNVEFSEKGDGEYAITLNEGDCDKLISELASHGAGIKYFAPQEKSLEDAFMEMIKNSGGSVI